MSLSGTCRPHLANGSRTPEHTGFCQKKWTQEKLHCSPVVLSVICHPVSCEGTSGHTSSLSFCPCCYFKPSANLFFCFSLSVFSFSHMRDRNSKKRRRKHVISSAHPPKTAVALKEALKEFACVSCRSEHVCMYVSVSACVPVGKRISLVSSLRVVSWR